MKKKQNKFISVLIGVFVFVFVLSAGKTAVIYHEIKQEQTVFEELKVAAEKSKNKFQELRSSNPDYVGWLKVPNTNIDYPVMQNKNDAEYYLRRNFDGAPSNGGTPFIGGGADVNSTALVIYSHNMRAKTMFATLDKYKTFSFYFENKDFTFETQGEVRKYRIFAAVKTNVNDLDENGKIYSDYTGTLNESEYRSLVTLLTENSLYNTGEQPNNTEQIMILSTCSYHTENGRFIVAAYRIE